MKVVLDGQIARGVALKEEAVPRLNIKLPGGGVVTYRLIGIVEGTAYYECETGEEKEWPS
jgi:hypothetical protein